MAPLALSSPEILDLAISSNELDSRSTLPRRHVIKRNDLSILSPISERSLLTARSPAQTVNPAAGSIPPDAINMKGIQAIIAIICTCFVLGSIWFFFWAKNGGFRWQKNDWEDYKSTVLRRKGPNGTTLSNATKSTRLGGGSVVAGGYSDRDGTLSDMSSEVPLKQKRGKSKKNKPSRNDRVMPQPEMYETAKDRKLNDIANATWEGAHDDEVRAYRHEKVARVGGLNKDSDAQYYGTDYSESDPSVTAAAHRSNPQHRQQPRTSSGAPRRSSRHASPEKGVRAAARREAHEAANAGPKRPARYHSPSKNSNRASMPGSFDQPMDFEVQSQNTRSYHHPIPGLSGASAPKAGNGNGYRRDRRDSLDD